MAGVQKHEIATFNTLKKAGHDVTYFKQAGVVQVILNDEKYYVYPMPNIEDYGTDFTSTVDNDYKYIMINNGNVVGSYIHLTQNIVVANGKIYSKIITPECNGYLIGNMYISYKDAWIKAHLYNQIIDHDPANFDDTTILDSEFKPVQVRQVNIIKYVIFKYINKNKFSKFTAFGLGDYFAAGKYSQTNRDDLFTCADENGKLYALLIDPWTKEVTLASDNNID